jgi:ribosomal protein L36
MLACNNNNDKKSIKKNRSVLFVCKKNPRHHCRLTGVDDRGHIYKPGMGGRLLFCC